MVTSSTRPFNGGGAFVPGWVWVFALWSSGAYPFWNPPFYVTFNVFLITNICIVFCLYHLRLNTIFALFWICSCLATCYSCMHANTPKLLTGRGLAKSVWLRQLCLAKFVLGEKVVNKITDFSKAKTYRLHWFIYTPWIVLPYSRVIYLEKWIASRNRIHWSGCNGFDWCSVILVSRPLGKEWKRWRFDGSSGGEQKKENKVWMAEIEHATYRFKW